MAAPDEAVAFERLSFALASKVELDRQYIQNAGFWQDGQILFNTVGVVLKGEGSR